MAEGLVYTVRDRSILLPLYKRLFVEPALPFIPARVDPNAITHAGHAINLAGLLVLVVARALHVTSGWPWVVAAICLQLYNFCDNADGAHARRTGRCSAKGELLDHGLDMLNTTYIAFMAALAIGAPPPWSTALAILVPAACAVTYWEQAETGLFSLGLLNQVESVMLLTTILVVTAIAGPEVYERLHVGPVTLRLALMTFTCATAVLGILRNVARVGIERLARVAPLLVLDAAVLVGVALSAFTPATGVIVATAGNVFFGVRCLALRTAGEKPRREPGVAAAALLVTAMIVGQLAGQHATAPIELAGTALAVLFFGLLALANARDAFAEVARLDVRRSRAW